MAGRSGLAKLDPRLYQYGGLWMYPVGAMIRTAMLVGLIQTPPPGTPAIEFYLDHPEAFGRFYVVARFYSWCWGVVAAFAIVWIARRITGLIGLSTLAAIAFMLTPAVRAATHEAKPHLAGAALCLCAVIAATRYVETGRRRWLLGAGALCGAAMAMVVSMLLSVVVLPTMVWLRRRATRRSHTPTPAGSDPSRENDRRLQLDPTPQGSAWSDRSVLASLLLPLACVAIVYSATNPFVLINAIARPEILRSNLGNSTAMYSPRSDGFHAVQSAILIAEAGLTFVGSGAVVLLASVGIVRASSNSGGHPREGLLLVVLALVSSFQFVLLAAGKPAEYARFGLLLLAVACTLGASGAMSIAKLGRNGELVLTIIAISYLGNLFGTFIVNEKQRSRGAATLLLDRYVHDKHLGNWDRIGTRFEPAPWSCPPTDLFQATLVLLPRDDFGRVVDITVGPSNLRSQLGSRFGSGENVDWLHNRFDLDQRQVSSDSDPPEYPPAGRTAPTSRGR